MEKEINLFIKGRLPGRNEQELWARGNKHAANNKRQAWKNYCIAEVLRHRIPKIIQARFGFTWIEPNRKRDPDNILGGMKFIFDALVYEGILKNDTHKQVAGFDRMEFEFDSKNPGVLVIIREVE